MNNRTFHLFTVIIFLSFWSPSEAQNNTVDPEILEDLITQKVEMDKKGVFKERFTVQIFYGKREAAEEIEKKYKKLDYTWECNLEWESPYLAVRVGSFKNRLQADRALLKIKEHFENATVMKP